MVNYTRAPFFEDMTFKTLGTRVLSVSVGFGQFEIAKKILSKQATEMIEKEGGNAAICAEMSYEYMVEWSKNFNDVAYPVLQELLVTFSFTFGIATPKEKVSE